MHRSGGRCVFASNRQHILVRGRTVASSASFSQFTAKPLSKRGAECVSIPSWSCFCCVCCPLCPVAPADRRTHRRLVNPRKDHPHRLKVRTRTAKKNNRKAPIATELRRSDVPDSWKGNLPLKTWGTALIETPSMARSTSESGRAGRRPFSLAQAGTTCPMDFRSVSFAPTD